MAARMFRPVSFKLEPNVVDLYFEIAIGGTGAPTATTGKCKGLYSITRTSAGLYVLTMGGPAGKDTYNRLLACDVMFIPASGVGTIVKTDVVSFASGNTLTILCSAPTPGSPAVWPLIATDPGSGDTMMVHVALSNSKAS